MTRVRVAAEKNSRIVAARNRNIAIRKANSMIYTEAIEFLLSGEGEIKPGLERISKLIQNLSNPHTGMKIIHIAGTNGKGSVAAYISNVLFEAGFRVGRFNSPWLSKVNNCICVDGEVISDEEIINSAAEILPYSFGVTQFEKLTALAFCHFRNKNCEYVVLEAGMGGSFDATNFISTSVVSVITKVSIDHQTFLGETLKEIAKHKAGIIKKGCEVVVAAQMPEVMTQILLECERKGAKLAVVNQKEINVEKMDLNGSRFHFGRDNSSNFFEIAMLGDHQIENCCLAILALRKIFGNCEKFKEYLETEEIIRNGVKNVVWPGRFEIVCRRPWVIVDGAHNVDGMKSLLAGLNTFFPKLNPIFIVGVMKDKEVEAMMNLLSKAAKRIISITPNNQRALHSFELAEIAKKYFENVLDGDTIENAIRIAMNEAKSDDVIVVCGSLYIDQVKDEVCRYVL